MIKSNKLTTFLCLVLSPVSVYAFPLTFREGVRNKTSEILKTHVDAKDVAVKFERAAVGYCKNMGRVVTLKKIEYWEKRKSCEIRIEALKLEVASVKANTLLVDVEAFGCDGVSMFGEAFLCGSQKRD